MTDEQYQQQLRTIASDKPVADERADRHHAERYLVFGSRGLLGQAFMDMPIPGVHTIGVNCDVTDHVEVGLTIKQHKPTVVINCAGWTNVRESETESGWHRAVSVNGECVAPLAVHCRLNNACLVQMSTDYVFEGENRVRETGEWIPYLESDPRLPQTMYGRSKAIGERNAMKARDYLIVRTAGLFGPLWRTGRPNFLESILRRALRGEELRVVNDQVCSPSYAPHVARAVAVLIVSGVRGIVHVTNAGATTWHDFAQEALRKTGIDAKLTPITSEQYAQETGDHTPRPKYSVLSTVLLDRIMRGSLYGNHMWDWKAALDFAVRDGMPTPLPEQQAPPEPDATPQPSETAEPQPATEPTDR